MSNSIPSSLDKSTIDIQKTNSVPSSPNNAKPLVGGSFRQEAIKRLINIWQKRAAHINSIFYRKYYKRKGTHFYFDKSFHKTVVELTKEKCDEKLKKYRNLLKEVK